MNTIKYIFVALLACSFAAAQAQGLEGIVVERYYQANAADVSNATAQGAVVPLTTGSVTYRVYVDMAAGYKFSQIFGSAAHALTVNATANFYNDPNFGVAFDPGTISSTNIRKNTAMIDSWFTTGDVAAGKVGVTESGDTDGSVGNAQSILANNPGSCFGVAINGTGAKDGFLPSSASTSPADDPQALGLGAALNVLDQTAGSSITINDGAIAALGGIIGATSDNLVLIGQFTTTGSLSFALNVQLINIATGVAENYVASSPAAGELTSASLTQTVTPTCPPASPSADSPAGASLVSYSSNTVYPGCTFYTSTLANSTNSAESTVGTGADVWRRFVAQSTAVRIHMNSTTMDDIIELYSYNGSAYTLLSSENLSASAGDFEILNYAGLTPGTTYYVSFGTANGVTGSFTSCIQHLMPSGCNYTEPAGGFDLCSNFKATYRGTTPEVTYTVAFNGVGGTAVGQAPATNNGSHVFPFSTPALGLRYGGQYDVNVTVNYNVPNGQGTPELIQVVSSAVGYCNDLDIIAAPLVEVSSTQRCPAVLTRGTALRALGVSGATSYCGAVNYTFEFTAIVNGTAACNDGTVNGLPTTYTTVSNSPFISLNVLPSGVATGSWDVRVRANFAYGSSDWGPSRRIRVSGVAGGSMLIEEESASINERSMSANPVASIYPNPSNGAMLAVNFTDLTGEMVQLRIMDATGREVFRSGYSVEGSLNRVLTFNQPLAAGLYMVEMTDGSHVVSERMIVKN
jgi:Secretion system C-terminal sorting domain